MPLLHVASKILSLTTKCFAFRADRIIIKHIWLRNKDQNPIRVYLYKYILEYLQLVNYQKYDNLSINNRININNN